jgi:hypothetical protein
MYDQLVDICIARAETLQLEIDDAQDRVQERDDCDTTGEHHEDIFSKMDEVAKFAGPGDAARVSLWKGAR